jgi:hypothetical protein
MVAAAAAAPESAGARRGCGGLPILPVRRGRSRYEASETLTDFTAFDSRITRTLRFVRTLRDRRRTLPPRIFIRTLIVALLDVEITFTTR